MDILSDKVCKISPDSRKKIISFYSRNANISFEDINIAIIHFLEQTSPMYSNDNMPITRDNETIFC